MDRGSGGMLAMGVASDGAGSVTAALITIGVVSAGSAGTAAGWVAMAGAGAGSEPPQKVSALGQMAHPDSSNEQTTAMLAAWLRRTMRW